MTKSVITITEALQECKTIDARISKKQEFINNFLFRQNLQRDPHEKAGGSSVLIAEERQSINDLLARKIAIRAAISKANSEYVVKIGEIEMTIADWLTWKREVAPVLRQTLNSMSSRINSMRNDARQKGLGVVQSQPQDVTLDIVVNLDEALLSKQIENLEETSGALDGQLSLKNATITIVI